jgi:anti-sigma-K factor RskA
MTDNDDRRPPEEASAFVAAEYVLGVLTVEERREVESRLLHEPALARNVVDWEERLGPLADEVRPVAAPSAAWLRIEAALDGSALPVARPVRARARTPAAAPANDGESLWQSVVFWRTFSLGSATLAALSIAALTYVQILPAPRAPMMATLGGATGMPNFVAAIGSGGRDVFVVPASLLTADQRAVELWLIPAGDRPHSLGLMAPGQAVRLTVPPELAERITDAATLAVSLEPPGGSPTGQPTGPVVATGKLTSL